jgi:hypothetical protein
MNIRTLISAVASLIAAFLGPILIWEISTQRQTGLGALVGGLVTALTSPKFWLLAVVLFAAFFGASRIGNRALRILLFWTPAVAMIAVALCFGLLLLYVRRHTPPS